MWAVSDSATLPADDVLVCLWALHEAGRPSVKRFGGVGRPAPSSGRARPARQCRRRAAAGELRDQFVLADRADGDRLGEAGRVVHAVDVRADTAVVAGGRDDERDGETIRSK